MVHAGKYSIHGAMEHMGKPVSFLFFERGSYPQKMEIGSWRQSDLPGKKHTEGIYESLPSTWQFCKRELFGMVSSRHPNSKVNRDLQLGDNRVTLNHQLCDSFWVIPPGCHMHCTGTTVASAETPAFWVLETTPAGRDIDMHAVCNNVVENVPPFKIWRHSRYVLNPCSLVDMPRISL